jgi:hypothetical protein
MRPEFLPIDSAHGRPAAEQLVVTSQGIHLVFDRSFLKATRR